MHVHAQQLCTALDVPVHHHAVYRIVGSDACVRVSLPWHAERGAPTQQSHGNRWARLPELALARCLDAQRPPPSPARRRQYSNWYSSPTLLPGSFSGVVPWVVAVPLPTRVSSFRCLERSTSTSTWLKPVVLSFALTKTRLET